MSDLYEDFVPTFIQIAEAQLGLMDKAEALCAEKGIAPETLLEDRLAPDMLPLKFQFIMSARHSAGALARVTGKTAPATNEETLPALRDQLSQSISFMKTLNQADFEDAESKPVKLELRIGEMNFTGRDYLASFAMPNFMFHASTAYALLRKAGVDIGKRDFMGKVRQAQPA